MVKRLRSVFQIHEVASLVLYKSDTLNRLGENKKKGNVMYDVAYIDSPWPYHQKSNKGSLRNKDKSWKYVPMSWVALSQLALPLEQNASAFVWTTGPLLPMQLEIMKRWGLHRFRLFRVFLKESRRKRIPFFGTGYYSASNCEFLIFGAKGQPCEEAFEGPVVQRSLVEAHSSKPQCFRDAVAAATPDCKRIEMFARSDTDERFDVHGDQTGLLRDQDHKTQAKNIAAASVIQPGDFRERTKMGLKRKRTRIPQPACSIRNRVIVVDLELAEMQKTTLVGLQDEHCFVIAKIDPCNLWETLQCYNLWHLEFKTIMFVSVDPNDDRFVQLWAVGVNSTTRITADGIKCKHVSSVIESTRGDAKRQLLDRIDAVFGAETQKLYIGNSLNRLMIKAA